MAEFPMPDGPLAPLPHPSAAPMDTMTATVAIVFFVMQNIIRAPRINDLPRKMLRRRPSP